VPLDKTGEFAGNFFTLLGFWRGGFNPLPLLVGVLGLSMFLLQGASWVAVKAEGDLHDRAVAMRSGLAWAFAVLVVLATVATKFFAPTAFANVLGAHVPVLGWVFIVLLLASVVWGRLASNGKQDLAAWYAVSLSAVSLTGLWAAGIFPNLVPSMGDAAGAATAALTVAKDSSSQLTLFTMLIIAIIGVPIVLFYMYVIYKTFAGKVSTGGEGY
jgi:cytochrome d ubiquinol oxidase subunit II